jgi:hypothetical protein
MHSLYNFGVASKMSISSLFFPPSYVDYNFGFASKASISSHCGILVCIMEDKNVGLETMIHKV